MSDYARFAWSMSNLAVDATDAFERLLNRVQNDPAVRYGSGLEAELKAYRQELEQLRQQHEELHGG
jgi:hypothetical protein